MSTTADADRAASTATAFLDRSDRVRLEVTGPDRVKFLHNLTTNDVKKLPVGQGAEAFVTSPQGKTLGYITLLAGEDRLTVRTDPGGAGLVLPHFRKYGVFDDVSIDDATGRTFEFHLVGPNAVEVIRAAGAEAPEAGELKHRGATVVGVPIRIVRESPFGGTGFTLIGDRNGADAVGRTIHEAGAGFGLVDLDPGSAEPLRIEAGTPCFGRDVTAENLPQEVARDSRAINFVKGCYLGQETVARIDALGHVNKLLRGLKVVGGPENMPAPGTVLEAEGKAAGAITSVAYSSRAGCVVALAYVRTAYAGAGTEVSAVEEGARRPAVVCDLPIALGL